MLRLTGRVTRVDLVPAGSFTDKTTGELIEYGASERVSVIVADQAIVQLKVPGNSPYAAPVVGEQIDVAVMRPKVQAGGLVVVLDKPWNDLFPPAANAKAA